MDVEPVFGKMKASLHFNRFSVRGFDKVTKEAGNRNTGVKRYETGHGRDQL
ncbi:hypothetical protein [Lactiplantibacillus plantarum]|uniref:hypothetical protein n=1 Tax=Lactiplantibacillus plantarum TaxID=1590 RepID=UPI003BA02270